MRFFRSLPLVEVGVEAEALCKCFGLGGPLLVRRGPFKIFLGVWLVMFDDDLFGDLFSEF